MANNPNVYCLGVTRVARVAPSGSRVALVQPIVVQPVDFDASGRPVIRWRSATDSFYRVLSASNLILRDWQEWKDQPSAGSQTEWTDTNAPQNRKYYRVRRVWP